MSRRSKVILGYLLIVLGICIPLYGFLKLSKNIIFAKGKFDSFMKGNQVCDSSMEKKVDEYSDSLTRDVAIVDPFANDNYASDYSFMKNKDEIFAYLSIPKIDLMEPIYLDASKKHLAMGVAHIEGTDLPSDKIGRRSVIAGHRGYYEAIMFWNLGKLSEGDLIYISWPNKTLEYKVIGSEIIEPWEWEKLDPVEGKNILTLLTCDPPTPPRKNRLLVNCDLQKKEDEISKDKIKKVVDVAEGVKTTNYIILGITILLMLSLLLFIFKLIKFLKA